MVRCRALKSSKSFSSRKLNQDWIFSQALRNSYRYLDTHFREKACNLSIEELSSPLPASLDKSTHIRLGKRSVIATPYDRARSPGAQKRLPPTVSLRPCREAWSHGIKQIGPRTKHSSLEALIDTTGVNTVFFGSARPDPRYGDNGGSTGDCKGAACTAIYATKAFRCSSESVILGDETSMWSQRPVWAEK